jgi:hypothetical protein
MSEQDQQIREKQALSKIIFKQIFDSKDIARNSPELISFIQGWLERYEQDWDSEFYMKILSDKYLFMKKIDPDAPTIGNVSGLPIMAERMYMSFNSFMSWLYLFDYGWAIEGDLDTVINFDGDTGVITSRLKDTNAVLNKIGINITMPSLSIDTSSPNPTNTSNPTNTFDSTSQKANYQKNDDKVYGFINREYLPYLIVLIALIILALLFV